MVASSHPDRAALLRNKEEGGTMVFVAEDALPTAEVFLDDRGSLLRVRWDEVAQQLEITVWREGVCVAPFCQHDLRHLR